MKKITRKITVLLAAVSVFFAFTARADAAGDAMQTTLTDALYGGAIGALVGTAVLLLSDHPGEHIDYIFTGAGVGVLGGVAYGLATSDGVVQRGAAEFDGEKFSLALPSVKRIEIYDEHINEKEVINSVDVVKLRF